jgi:hypothetical protein
MGHGGGAPTSSPVASGQVADHLPARDVSQFSTIPFRTTTRLVPLHSLFWLGMAISLVLVLPVGRDHADRAGAQTPTSDVMPAPTATPCGAHADCDGVPDVGDNCPNLPNSNQGLPPWPVPAGDPDCDGFSTAVETSAGTDPLLHCGVNAWPVDVTNDSTVGFADIGFLTSDFGVSDPPAPARHDIAPDPVDGVITFADIGRMTDFFGLTCATPPVTPTPTPNPTPSPTDTPTPSPTDSPTHSPTDSPTPSPTDSPTPSPTDSPTPSPTPTPTPSPPPLPRRSRFAPRFTLPLVLCYAKPLCKAAP